MDRLECLTIFVAVADRASFAEAARALHRSPAAVTRAVAGLEAQLQARLLNRTTRSVSLTEAGQRVLETGRALLAKLEELESVGDGDALMPRGVVSVTAASMFGRLHVLPLLHALLARYPALDIRLRLTDRVESLVEEGMDVGVRLGNLPDSSLRSLRVGQVRRGVYASPAYLARAGVPAALSDLAGHPVIACLALTPVPERWTFAGAEGSQTVTVKPRLVVNTPDAAVDSALAGVGLTCVASYQVANEVASGRLVEVLGAWAPAPVPVTLVQPAGRHVAPRVRVVVGFLAEGIRAKFGGSEATPPKPPGFSTEGAGGARAQLTPGGLGRGASLPPAFLEGK